MKIIFQLIFLCFFLQLRSQTEVIELRGKFEIGFSGSPDYSYRFLKTGESDAWMKKLYDTSEIARVGYTAGLQVVFHSNERLFFNSGLLFSDRGEKTKKYLLPPTNNYINHYYYLSVPLKANYYITTKKVKVFLSAGLSADFYLRGHSDVESGNAGLKKPISFSSKVSDVNVSFNGGFGLDCPVTDRWYFKLQPEYHVSLTPISDSPVKKYFYSLGLNMGFFYRF